MVGHSLCGRGVAAVQGGAWGAVQSRWKHHVALCITSSAYLACHLRASALMDTYYAWLGNESMTTGASSSDGMCGCMDVLVCILQFVAAAGALFRPRLLTLPIVFDAYLSCTRLIQGLTAH